MADDTLIKLEKWLNADKGRGVEMKPVEAGFSVTLKWFEWAGGNPKKAASGTIGSTLSDATRLALGETIDEPVVEEGASDDS